MTGSRGFSGRPVDEVTIDSVRDGEIAIDDVRIHPDTLVAQAEVAAAHANPNLAANLLRAAELTGLPDREVLDLYERLRPYRSSAQELQQIAADLEGRGAPRNAELFRQAASVYERRGLVKR